jgi:polar amino acid transport system substrate-binding protein
MGTWLASGPKRDRSFSAGGRRGRTWIALAVLGLFAAAPLAAQTTAQPAPAPAEAPGSPPASDANGATELAVATRVVAPFVIEGSPGELSGFSVDLWRAIAAEAGLKSHFQTYETLPELMSAVQTGKNPVGIAAISITADREKTLDFSQPMFRSGMQIMAPVGQTGVADLARSVLSPGPLTAIGIVLLVLLIPAHIGWLIHRLTPSSDWKISRAYWPGVLQALYWAAEKMIQTSEGAPGGALGRLFNNVWAFLCVLLLASFTALIASALTLSSLRSDINGPSDLVGKRIASVKGSTSAAYLREIGASVAEYPNFADAAAALDKSKGGSFPPVALVYDAPIVLYYINNDGSGKFQAVGAPFRAENYGIVFPLNSGLRLAINAALLKLTEDGTYQQINDKWFGKSGGPS